MGEPFGVWFGGSHLGFGTHMHVLAAVILQARPGPVLEYGMGFYSTPLLHLLCQEMDRHLLSIDGDPTWADRFAGLESGRHDIKGVRDWAESEPMIDGFNEWAVVFIDHGPETRRVVDAKRLKDRAEFIVVHDWSNTDACAAWQEELLKMFKFSWVSKVGPCTAVLSNKRPFVFPKGYVEA